MCVNAWVCEREIVDVSVCTHLGGCGCVGVSAYGGWLMNTTVTNMEVSKISDHVNCGGVIEWEGKQGWHII